MKLFQEYIDDMVVRMAHHSTAIEGNTLTQGETKSILLENFIPRQMNAREFFEVSNYRKYINYLIDTYKEPITLETIKKTQSILLENLRDDAGKFKTTKNIVLGADFTPVEPYQVPEALKNWTDTLSYRLEIATSDDDKIRAIMESHLQFELIHPFPDGNGRTGRALMIHSCLQSGIAPIIIEKSDKDRYIAALNTQNREELYQLGKELASKEMERYTIIYENYGV